MAPYAVKVKSHEFNPWGDRTPVLSHLDIELTERCDNACIHCYINQAEEDQAVRAREMSTDFVKDLLQQAADLGSLSVHFTGGEPLLREDFGELYLFARNLGMKVIIFTNARKITPELALLLARIPPGKPVEISVYGMRAETYDAVAARHGAFAEYWRGINLLRKYNIPIVVKQSILPPNYKESEEFEAFAAALQQRDARPRYTMNFDLRARRDNPAKNRQIQSLRLSPEETVDWLTRNPHYVPAMRKFCAGFVRPASDTLFACGAGLGIFIDAYGQAQMCMGLRDPAMVFRLAGNKAAASSNNEIGGTLLHALKVVFPEWRKTKATNPEYLRRCARCFLKGLCEQCPAKSWQEHGTLDTPVEYLCKIAHAQACYLGLIRPDEKAWEVPDSEWPSRIARFATANGSEAELGRPIVDCSCQIT